MKAKSSEAINQRIASIKELILRNGYCGAAWEFLRLSKRYRAAWRRHSAGRIEARHVRSEFGLREPKDYKEGFGTKPPRFARRPTLVRCPTNEPTVAEGLTVRRKSVLLNSRQVAVVISLSHNVSEQLSAIKKKLLDEVRAQKQASTLVVGPQKLGSLEEDADYFARLIVAYDLATFEEWGPTKIGKAMFPGIPRDSAKCKARDLTDRAREYVETGYWSLVIRSWKPERVPRQKRPAPAPAPNPKVAGGPLPVIVRAGQ